MGDHNTCPKIYGAVGNEMVKPTFSISGSTMTFNSNGLTSTSVQSFTKSFKTSINPQNGLVTPVDVKVYPCAIGNVSVVSMQNEIG